MDLANFISISKVDNVVLMDKTDGKNKSLDCTLCVSSHHLIVSPRKNLGQEVWVSLV